MKNPEDFFSISGRSVSKGGTLLPMVGFTPELARAVIETQGAENAKSREEKLHFFPMGPKKPAKRGRNSF